MKTVLITGGAGFIGSHVAEALLAQGHHVRALDNLSAQVHGPDCRRPAYLNPDVELITGDIRDAEVVRKALRGVDRVVHFVAVVGVGQSMYEIARYTSVNNVGTAVLLEALIDRPVERLLVASSMSVYGEGLYRASDGTVHYTVERSVDHLRRGDWEMRGPNGEALQAIATPETKPPSLASVYALSKYDQERMCMMVGAAYKIPAVALRFFNTYGPNQALSNPYTGVLAIFASRLLNNKAPVIFEDGRQQRDFVSVYDVARACRLALEVPEGAGKVFNVGSGEVNTVAQAAERVAAVLGKRIAPEISGQFRVGDIRHCFPDISLARNVLGYQPQVSLEAGLVDLAAWLEGQAAKDYLPEMRADMVSRGLMG